ncbi:protease, putative [plant metagenome]|uniref:Protease, putative n=2 Tax=root TaxID=1 RepID=A0A1C3K5K1_9BURK|nr:PDZ domain-containing protein [Orrella dioscoreae]SBT26776.1 protease, putative [Orrella dioscoreae]SOE52375.1 protease, putative [Orrella dioscoreae]
MKPTPALLYRLQPADPAGHRYRITLTVDAPDPAGQRFTLPAWIPGSYLIRDFSRQVETISARAGTRAVALTKHGDHGWTAAPCRGPLTLAYTVYAWDLSVRGAHLDDTHGFFNGTSVFLRVEGQEDQPCLLDIAEPVGIQGWKVYTSLPEARGMAGAARRHGFGLYAAPDYDALIDHPVEMGTPQVVRFTAHGAEHEMVFTGEIPNLDLARIAEDTRRICEAQIAFFEPRTKRAPFLDSATRYVFMTQVTGDAYGGLEHRASTALMASRKDLPARGQAGQSEGYRTFLGLVSHEYFHTWHVKRIKPAAFAPYDLSAPAHTRLLWVFEGFTSYYDDLMLLRAGVIDRADYLGLVGKTIGGVARAPGRHKQSVAQSSHDAWTRYYKQDENSPNALVSYYTKGSLVALGLDLTIRQATGNRQSLDDVMRLMWRRHGRDFYRTADGRGGAQLGVPEDGMAALVHDATGVDVSDFLRRYVEGVADVPLDTLLPAQGVPVRWKAGSALPGLDARTRKQGDTLALATVHENGAAHRAGLSAGDVLVAIDGLKVDAGNLDTVLQRYQPGQAVTLHAFRRDELRTFTLRLAAPGKLDCVLG